jgi:UDP-glucuronate decarboxylase
MKYLVTGGAGFIGSNLCRKLLADGDNVACLDDLSTGKYRNIEELGNNPNFEFLNHDLTKPFFPEKIDGIFNLACPASPVHYQYNPIRTLKMGTLAMYNVLGMAARLNVPILQASTSEIYGDPSENPQKESYLGNVNSIGPRACYDEGKRVAEALCIAYESHNNVQIRIARIFNTYGAFMDPKDGRVVSNFIVQALKGDPLTVYGDGSQTRSFCYVDDLVSGLISLIQSDYKRPVNLGNPEEFTMIEFASLVKEKTSSDSEIIFMPLPIDDPKQRCPDISLAKETLQWTPKVSVNEGLDKTIEWYRRIIKL